MNTWIIVLSAAIFIGVGANQLQNTSVIGNQDRDEEYEGNLVKKSLTISWIKKIPYTTTASNGSQDDEGHGLIRNVLMPHVLLECGIMIGINYHVKTFRADNEFHMIQLLRQNKVHIAAPIFEPTNRRYHEFSFFKITDYPESEFITSADEGNKLTLVLHAVMKSWSLFAVTLILTAIAGVFMWSLVSLTLST